MHPEPRALLADIEKAGTDIERLTKGLEHDTYSWDDSTQAAVERQFEIIGEALNRLHVDHPDLFEKIPRLRRIVDFRNLLSPGFNELGKKRVWTFEASSLPELRQAVRSLLAELGPAEK